MKVIMLAGFFVSFMLILNSSTLQLYVHPKMTPYLKFGAFMMFIILLGTCFELSKIPRKKVRLTTYTIFFIPLIISLFFEPAILDSSSLPGRNLSIGMRNVLISSQARVEGSSSQANDHQSVTEKPQEIPEVDIELVVVDGIIKIEDYDFVAWLLEIEKNFSKYDGLEIIVEGFVYRDETFADNEFALARYVMTCCTADMQLIGYFCISDESVAEIPQDTWLKVNGVFIPGEYQGSPVPKIELDSIERINPPAVPYVYPYF